MESQRDLQDVSDHRGGWKHLCISCGCSLYSSDQSRESRQNEPSSFLSYGAWALTA